MKIAIPVQGDHVATVVNVADELLIIEQESLTKETLSRDSGSRNAHIARVDLLKTRRVDVLICGAVPGFMQRMIEAAGIRVLPFIRGTVEEVLDAFNHGNLMEERFLLPGCCPRPLPSQRQERLRGGMGERNGIKKKRTAITLSPTERSDSPDGSSGRAR